MFWLKDGRPDDGVNAGGDQKPQSVWEERPGQISAARVTSGPRSASETRDEGESSRLPDRGFVVAVWHFRLNSARCNNNNHNGPVVFMWWNS